MKNYSMVTATCLALALFTLSATADAGGFVSKDGKYYLCYNGKMAQRLRNLELIIG